MHRGCFVWTPTPPSSGQRMPHPGPARVCVCVPCFAGSGGLGSRARSGAPHLSFGRSWFALCLFGPVCGCCGCWLFPFPLPPPSLHPGTGRLGPRRLVVPPPFSFAPPSPVVSGVSCFPVAWGLCAPPPFFFPLYLVFLFSVSFSFFCRLCGAGRVCVSWAVECARVCLGGAVPVVALCALAGVAWCSLLGLAVLCCVLVGLGVVLRWCRPCLAAWLAALWFGVVCLGVPLPCVVFCCAVLSCGGVLSCSAVCLRRCLQLLFVFWGVVLCVPCPLRALRCCAGALSLCCARRFCCFWWLVLLVPGVAAFCWGSAGGFGCPALSFGGVCQLCVWSGCRLASSLWCPAPLCCVLWRCAAVWCCAMVPCLLFLFFSLLVAIVSCCSPLVRGSGPVPGRFCFCALPVRCCAGVPASLLSVRCSLALAVLAAVLCCCLLCLCVCCWAWLSSVVSWWVLVAPGVASRWRAVVCPWLLCCAVLLHVVPPGVALLCAVLFRFAPFGAAARCVVSRGAVRRLGVLCLLAPCFVLSPGAVCVLLWCVAAWCCSPLCFVPCAPWGPVLCVSCHLRPVRCCCVTRSPSVPCSPVLCPVVLCCRVVPWCPVLQPSWVCFLRWCGCTYLMPENRLIRDKKQEISTPLQIALIQPPTRPWQKDERAQYVCCHEARAFLVCVLP